MFPRLRFSSPRWHGGLVAAVLWGMALGAVARDGAPAEAMQCQRASADTAATADADASGWRIDCLRQQYQGKPGQWPRPWIDDGVPWQELAPVPPAQPPVTAAEQARLTLGTALFHDPGLSGKGAVSCATCHQAVRSFTDGLPLAVGEDRLMGKRRSQPLFAAPFAPLLFWDGRAASLEEQARGPIENPLEMNSSLEKARAYIASVPQYQQWAEAAFGSDGMADDEWLSAIASFVRVLRPASTAADAAIAGDTQALDDAQLLGLHLFRTKARCMNCHHGALLTDNRFHNIGLSFFGRRNQDLGRFEHTRDPTDLGTFRTPSLRGVAQAGPWMHNGIFPNLPGIVRMYNAGMGNMERGNTTDDPLTPVKSPHIQELNLTDEEIKALVAWLEVL